MTINSEAIDNSQQAITNVESVQPDSVVDTTKTSKLLSQDEVNNVVKAVKLSAYEKGRREALSELEKDKKASNVDKREENVRQYIDSLVDQKVANIIKSAQEEEITRNSQAIVNNFVDKMKSADRNKYPDFEENVSKLNFNYLFNEAPNLMAELSNMDNAADLMYSLSKSPKEVASLIHLNKMNPKLAVEEMERINKIVNQNINTIKNRPLPKEPLSQVKSSTSSGADNDSLTVSDFRRLLNKSR